MTIIHASCPRMVSEPPRSGFSPLPRTEYSNQSKSNPCCHRYFLPWYILVRSMLPRSSQPTSMATLVFRVAPHHDVNCCSTTLQINFPPTTSPHSLSMHFHVPHLYRSHPFQSPDTVSIQSGRGWERRGSGFLGHGRARTIFKHASLVLFWCSCLYIGV